MDLLAKRYQSGGTRNIVDEARVVLQVQVSPADPVKKPARRSLFGAEGKVVWALAGPAVALNGLQVVNSLLDTFFIGHLSKAALTAHGAAMNVLFMMFSLGMAISVASTALVSRAYGANEPEEYRSANRHCLSLSLVIGVILAAICIFLIPLVAPALIPRDNPEAGRQFLAFLSVYAFSIPASAVITTLSGSMRGIGDTKSPMFISGMQIFLHMILNLFFIYPSGDHSSLGIPFYLPGLGWGLPGAAAALSISAWVSALVYAIYAGRTKLGNVLKLVIPTRNWIRRIMNIAVPSALQSVMRVGSFTAFTLMLKNTPTASDALGALRIGIAIEAIMFMPAFGLSVAAGALVGQNLGAKDPERAARLGWISAHYAAIVIFVLSVPLFILAPQIASILTGGDKPAMAMEAVMYIRIIIATEVLFGYAMVLIGAMQGAGDAKRTMWITIATLWLVRVPLAYVMTRPELGLGATGAWVAMTVSQAAQGLLSMYVWRKGYWKHVKV